MEQTHYGIKVKNFQNKEFNPKKNNHIERIKTNTNIKTPRTTPIFNGGIPQYLKRRQILSVELLDSVVSKLVFEFGAKFPRLEATPNPVPRVGVVHSLLQPVGVIPEPVLLIPSIGKGLTSTFVGDNEGEDGERKGEKDEQEHDQEVEPEEPRDTTTCANETGQRHHQKEHA